MEFTIVGQSIVPNNPNDIKALRQVDPNELNDNELFRYYAKSRIQAEYMMDNIQPPDGVTRNSVIAVYSFLQAVNQLAQKKYIRKDDFSDKAYWWLNKTICCTTTCDNAVGIDNLNQILTQYQELDLYRYNKLYEETLNLKTVDYCAYCEIFRKMQENFDSQSDDQILKINKKKITAQVAIAVSECLWRASKSINDCKIFKNNEEKENAISSQIVELKKQVKVAGKWGGLAQRINNQIDDLQRLLENH